MERTKCDAFDQTITKKLGNSFSVPPEPYDHHLDPDPEPAPFVADADSYHDYDRYINTEVLLPRDNGRTKSGKIIGRATDPSGNPIGKEHPIFILDSRLYEVKFQDGLTKMLAANGIEINLYLSVDLDGHAQRSVERILDH